MYVLSNGDRLDKLKNIKDLTYPKLLSGDVSLVELYHYYIKSMTLIVFTTSKTVRPQRRVRSFIH